MRCVSWRKLLQLLLAVCYVVVLAECEGDDESGSSCGDGNIGPDLLPLSMPSSDIKSDLILNMVDTSMCGGGCVTAWRFCYYSARENVKQTLTVPVTFALWRRAGNGTDMVAVVEGSRFSLTITLPVEQWFLCERRVLESRCGVQVGAGDMVGVVIHNDTPLRMVGVSGNGLVAVGGRVQGERGSVTRGSLQERAGHALMLAALVDDTCDDGLMPSDDPCGDPPTIPTPAEQGRLPLWAIVVLSFLGLVVIVLLVILVCICISRKRCSRKKGAPLQSVLLNTNVEYYRNKSPSNRSDFEMHILNTNTSGSTHSSPTPNLPRGVTNTQLNGHSRTDLMMARPPGLSSTAPGPSSLSSTAPGPAPLSSTMKKPPPVKPKPLHLSSRKTLSPPEPDATQPVEAAGHSPPLTGHSSPIATPPYKVSPKKVSPSHDASLCRSYSEETLKLSCGKHPPEEKPNLLLPRSPQHRGMKCRMSTGSLPDIFFPSMDEDYYTIPTHLLPHPQRRGGGPQPYLQPQPIYSYAYTNVATTLAGQFLTVPRRELEVAAVVVKQRCQSDTADPYDSIHTPQAVPQKLHPQLWDSDYDEIFLERDRWTAPAHQDIAPVENRLRGPTTVPSGHGGKLRSFQSSPITRTHAPQTPLSEHPFLLSTGSEGYVNENEFPRPSTGPLAAGPPELHHLDTRQHYTPLQPTLREECSTYDLPQVTSTSSDHDPFPSSGQIDNPSPMDYDHLDNENSLQDLPPLQHV